MQFVNKFMKNKWKLLYGEHKKPQSDDNEG